MESLAWELGLPTRWDKSSFDAGSRHLTSPIEFVVKSETEGRDLFYRFDTLGQFHAANRVVPVATLDPDKTDPQQPGGTTVQGPDQPPVVIDHTRIVMSDIDPRRYVRYQGLGLAILLAKGRDGIPPELMTDSERRRFPVAPCRSVVLIDEIDKAPRDVPNDLLTEIENQRFTVPELNHEGFIELTEAERAYRPIVLITSNSERELPPAFLRRCVYFHLGLPPFADKGSTVPRYSVEAIVEQRLGKAFQNHRNLFGQAISWFRYLRDDDRKRLSHPVSLAEFLDWLRSLSVRMPEASGASLESHPDFKQNFSSLIKNKNDQAELAALLEDWQRTVKESARD